MGSEVNRDRLRSPRRLALAVVAVACIGLALPAAGQANAISTWGSWNGSSAVTPFGDEGSATYGQVVTGPPQQASLQSFTFYVKLPPQLVFQAYVYAWNGSEATGPALYEGPAVHTTEEGVYQPITVQTGNISVTPGQKYVLFISVSKDEAADRGTGKVGLMGVTSSSAYEGGTFVYLNNEYSPGAWTTESWTEISSYDAAFTAVFATEQEVAAEKAAEAQAAATKNAEEEASAKQAAAFEAAVKKLAELEAKTKAEEAAKKRAEEEAKTTIVLDGSTITLRASGEAPIRITCSGVGTCTGTLTLELKGATGKGKHKHTKIERVGAVSFSVPAGTAETVDIAVDGAGRSLLKSSGGHIGGTLVILKSAPAPSTTLDDAVHLSEKLAKKGHK